MPYICKFCNNKFTTKKVEVTCPTCGEDYFIEKIVKQNNKNLKLKIKNTGEKQK